MTTATFIENEHHLFEKRIQDQAGALAQEFKQATRLYLFFHIGFLAFILGEVFSFVMFLSFWLHSPAIAFLIASFLLGVFSYFVLCPHIQGRKEEQLGLLVQNFVHSIHEHTSKENHLSIAHGIYRAVLHLDRMEEEYYVLPFAWETPNILLKKFSIYCHWRDVLKVKELLLFEALSEHVELIKKEPSDLEAHAALGEAYLKLASLYEEKKHQGEEPLWIPPEYSLEPMRGKHRKALERALEEFKIIETYLPEDPWVHAQIARIYRDLKETEQEIASYEIILKLSPRDSTVMSYLGMLYFREGKVVKGLKMYQKLKEHSELEALELLKYYDAYDIKKF